jgi:hypothetical protein
MVASSVVSSSRPQPGDGETDPSRAFSQTPTLREGRNPEHLCNIRSPRYSARRSEAVQSRG